MTMLLLLACSRNIEDPPDIAWDHAACAECGMLVSDPAYAAALVEKNGTLLPFDDPGCMFKYILEHHPSLHAMWFHDGAHDRWMREGEAAFTTGHVSPMGSGLMPVPVGTTGAIGVGEASAYGFSR